MPNPLDSTSKSLTRERPLAVQAKGHFVLLDWIRFLAALLVVFCHVRPEHWVAWNELDADSRTWAAKLFLMMIRIGPESVVIFFVLSGYLVGGKVIQRCADGTFAAADYFRDRFSRIFTPLVPAILVTVTCVWFLYDGFPAGYGWELLGNIFQMQGILCDRLVGDAPLWSLSYEVWFYALAGGAAIICGHFSKPIPTGRVLAAAVLVLFSSWCLVALKTAYLFCWLFGAFAYVFPVKKPGRLGVTAAFAVALLAIAICQATGSYQGGLIANSELVHQAGVLLLGASIAFLLPFLSHSGNRLGDSRLARLGPRLAAFSYTLYLTHYPLLLVMRSWHAPYHSFSAFSLLLYLAKIGVCVIAAWVLYLPFERKTPQVRRFLQQTWPFGQRPATSRAHA